MRRRGALQPSQIHDVGVFLAADYSKPIEIPVSQLSELLQGHFRMAQCPHGWLTKEAPKKSKNGSGDLDEAMRNRIRERFGFTTANQTFPLQGGFHRVTFAQFLNHDGDDANVARDRKKPVATYKFAIIERLAKKATRLPSTTAWIRPQKTLAIYPRIKCITNGRLKRKAARGMRLVKERRNGKARWIIPNGTTSIRIQISNIAVVVPGSRSKISCNSSSSSSSSSSGAITSTLIDEIVNFTSHEI